MSEDQEISVKYLGKRPASKETLDGLDLSQETIDLTGLFARDVSSSGSFDLRQFRLTSVGKLLDALPIPALLLDQFCGLVFANRSCEKIGISSTSLGDLRFSSLFSSLGSAAKAEALIEKVVVNRIPLVSEGFIGIGKKKIRGRMHVRALRIRKQRSVLVIIEDITTEKKRAETKRKA